MGTGISAVRHGRGSPSLRAHQGRAGGQVTATSSVSRAARARADEGGQGAASRNVSLRPICQVRLGPIFLLFLFFLFLLGAGSQRSLVNNDEDDDDNGNL